MKKSNSSGRPPAKRNLDAGRQLGIALKVLGKTWRRDTENPNHVLNWDHWITCELPRSATTIDKDIRQGVPVTRLSAYAHCLGITPGALASADTDMHEILGPGLAPDPDQTPSLVMNCTDRFPELYLENNSETYIRKLFTLINGVYRMHYLLYGVDIIHRCSIWIHQAEAYRILAKGIFIMFGVENMARGNIFRWHNNLHMHYLCQNGMELGYVMTVDPLRHNLVQRRAPFWLKGHGLTDRGLAGNTPVTFVFKKEKLSPQKGIDLEKLWKMKCDHLRKRPFIAPGELEYEALWSEITAPDEPS